MRGAIGLIGVALGSAALAQPLPPRRPPQAASVNEPAPVPVPPPRPSELAAASSLALRPHPLVEATPLGSATPGASDPAPMPPAGAVPLADELTCVRLFTSRKVEARAAAPVPPTPAGCGIPAPAEISAVLLASGQRVALEPPATMNCALGLAVADWVREDLAPAFAAGPSRLAALTGTGVYACRGRNNVAGAKTSEHGRGNALDIGGFRTEDKTTLPVRGAGNPLLGTVKATACARFATVLGPGSDGYHESHMHVDLEPRRHGSKICHWDMAPGST